MTEINVQLLDTVETVYWVAICPRGNLPYIRSYPINNAISALTNTQSTHHKSTLKLYLPFNRLPHKWFVLYRNATSLNLVEIQIREKLFYAAKSSDLNRVTLIIATPEPGLRRF